MEFLKPTSKKKISERGVTTKVLKQTGTVKSVASDRKRRAQLPGKRVSKSGKVYWETRKNRSDQAFKDI